MKQTKKSILGLNTVKMFVIVLLAVAIIGVISLVVLGALNSPQLQSTTGIVKSGTTVNQTYGVVNETSQTLNATFAGYNSLSCTPILAINSTDSVVINAPNYTYSGCNIAFNGGTAFFNNTAWKITYSWSYRADNGAAAVTQNVSSGIISFFNNSGTYFSLLGVVVIILIISLVVVVVNRFGGEQAQSNGTM